MYNIFLFLLCITISYMCICMQGRLSIYPNMAQLNYCQFFVGVFTFKTSSWELNDGNCKKVISPIIGDEGSDADMGAVIVDAKQLFPDIIEEKPINQRLTCKVLA